MSRLTKDDERRVVTDSDDVVDSGQATSEYALVMLAAALIALLAVGWASDGGGAGKIGQMFDRVLEDVTSRVP